MVSHINITDMETCHLKTIIKCYWHVTQRQYQILVSDQNVTGTIVPIPENSSLAITSEEAFGTKYNESLDLIT